MKLGRKPKTKVRDAIFKLHQKKPTLTYDEIAALLKEKYGIKSRQHVYYYLKQLRNYGG